MSTELTVQEPTEIVSAEVSTETLGALPHMQASLLTWCRTKRDLSFAEARELREAYDQALAHKWKTATIKKHADLADKRAAYYGKLADAMEAGYCVFPTIDCDIFAIRTDKESPKHRSEFFRYGRHPAWEEKSDVSPVGEGEYVNPVPANGSYEHTINDPTTADLNKKVAGREFYTLSEFDKIQFPLSMAKPHIMDAVGRAMALKIFDEIGIIGDATVTRATATRRRDPLIVGRVLNPKRQGYGLGHEDAVTFLIVWHIQTRDLEI